MRAGLRGCRPAAGRRRPSHWLKLLPQYVNALSPLIAGERVGVEGWGGNGHLLEAYSVPYMFAGSGMCTGHLVYDVQVAK